MAAFTRVINGVTVIAEADPTVENQALGLLELLAGISHGAVSRGETVELGWGPVIPEVVGNGTVRLRVPDYAGDPYTELTYDLTIALWVLYEQGAILRQLGSTGRATRFDEKVVYAQGALESDQRVYANRIDATTAKDSGWFVGFVPPGTPQLEATRAFKLLNRRRELVKFLALPPGYMLVMTGTTVESLTDSDGTNFAEQLLSPQ